MVVDIGGVNQGVSELLQVIYTKSPQASCGFASILNLNFGFPNFAGRVPLWRWTLVVSDMVSMSCYRQSIGIQTRKISVAVLPQF